MNSSGLHSKDSRAVFLVGFMGSGKTLAGRALARRLGYRFVDLDDLIESRSGKPIRGIFLESGEARFRELEREALEESCGLKSAVIALGGGAYVSEENRALVASAGIAVWLDCPLDVCWERVAGDKSRPLAANENDFRSLYEQRRAAYAQADMVVHTQTRSPDEIASEIVEMLKAIA
ncbi:MAG TPA: shikimate kinase [Blastocatellia bacterium]|nr:shikimate kinase [Blastocatellia bacterium]